MARRQLSARGLLAAVREEQRALNVLTAPRGQGRGRRRIPTGQARLQFEVDDAYRMQRWRAQGIGTIRDTMRRVAPIVTGRLRHSMQVHTGPYIAVFSFNTPYAAWVDENSKRNSRYVKRGVGRGIIAANNLRNRPDLPRVRPYIFSVVQRGIQTNKQGRIAVRVNLPRLGRGDRHTPRAARASARGRGDMRPQRRR